MKKSTQEITITRDLNSVIGVLNPEDANVISSLKEELQDNWLKNQIFRTETEMKVSVLNDVRHPTNAAKYWQCVREMNGHFEALIFCTFTLRRNHIKRLKLEQKLQKAIENNDELKQMSIQIDIEENLYHKASMELEAKDRVREIKTWSKLKSELDDNTFDTQDVSAHQTKSLKLYFENRVKALNNNSDPSEIMNAVGPFSSINRLTTEDNKLLPFNDAKLKLKK
jgi:hypothetical protein